MKDSQQGQRRRPDPTPAPKRDKAAVASPPRRWNIATLAAVLALLAAVIGYLVAELAAYDGAAYDKQIDAMTDFSKAAAVAVFIGDKLSDASATASEREEWRKREEETLRDLMRGQVALVISFDPNAKCVFGPAKAIVKKVNILSDQNTVPPPGDSLTGIVTFLHKKHEYLEVSARDILELTDVSFGQRLWRVIVDTVWHKSGCEDSSPR